MAISERLILDLSQAQSQLDDLERQLDSLLQPIEIPVGVDVDTAQFDNIARALGVSEQEAEELTAAISRSVGAADGLDDELSGVARELNLSEQEASDFSREMRNAEGSARSAGDEIEDVGRRGSSAFRNLATVIGGVVAALGLRQLFSSIVTAGFERFTTIEDASRALTIQLEDSAAAAQLLEETLDVVRGTPFNLDQFAAAAQQLVGFGVEIDRIPGILTAIGEAAATQGARAPEFVDRLVTVFGQITTTGRIALEDINRIADTGVNALVILANAFGVTTGEMRDMISEGAVPAGEAIDILTEGIVQGTEGVAGATVALGGTMEGLRETLSGAIDGMQAALARLGESFFDVLGASSIEGVNAITEAVDLITASVDNLERVDVEAVARNIAGLPSAISTTFSQISAGGETVGNALQVFGALARLDFGDVGVQFSQLGDDIQRFREAGIENTAIQNLLTTLSAGVDPALALAQVLDQLGENVDSLTVESFEVLAAQLLGIADASGITAEDLRILSHNIEESGEAAGFSEAGIAILLDLLRQLRGELASELTPEEENVRAFFAGIAGGADDASEALEGTEEAAEAFQKRVSDFRVERITLDIGDIAGQFDALPDGLDAAADALRNKENEITTDFSVFLGRLDDELAAQQAFRDNIEILESLGLDQLAQLFRDEGLEAAAALADAVANPAEAQRAEELLDEHARNIGTSFRQTLIDEITGQGLDLTIPADATIVINSLVAQGLSTADAQRTVGNAIRGELGGVGSPAADINITQNFEGKTVPDTETARAAQAVNGIISTNTVS